jgi:hypothetical protein
MTRRAPELRDVEVCHMHIEVRVCGLPPPKSIHPPIHPHVAMAAHATIAVVHSSWWCMVVVWWDGVVVW